MHIAVWPPEHRNVGGTFQYSWTMLEALPAVCPDDRLTLVYTTGGDLPLESLARDGYETLCVAACANRGGGGATRLGRVLAVSARIPARARLAIGRAARRSLRERLRRHGIDLVVYPAPTEVAFEVGLPYVMAIHDLLYHEHPEFPEAFVHGDARYYDYLYGYGARYATAILVDSETGRRNLLRAFAPWGARPERVHPLPFTAPPALRQRPAAERLAETRKRLGLPDRFFLYPARLWPHKNHARLLRALAFLRRRYGLVPALVFTGHATKTPAPEGELPAADLKALARGLGVDRQVHWLGYLADDDLTALYAACTGLVMPTMCGPTSIPVLEAWQMGCPVLTSRIAGVEEQVGDAALLVDPESEEEIGEGLRRLWTDRALREDLVRRGHQRAQHFSPAAYRRRLSAVIECCRERLGRRAEVAALRE